MKSLAADKLKVARILLNLGHSYLNSTSLDNSEDEEEEEDDDEEKEGKEKEEQNQQLDDKKQQIETIENMHQNIEKKPQIHEEIHNDNDGSIQLNDKLTNEVLDEMLKYFYKDKQNELYTNLKINEKKHEIEKEKTQILSNSLQQPLFNSNCRELCSTDTQKQSHTNLHLNMNGHIQNKQNDLQQKFGNEIQYNSDEIAIVLCNKNRHNNIVGHRNRNRHKSQRCVEKDVFKKIGKKKLLAFSRKVLEDIDKKQRFVKSIDIQPQIGLEFRQEIGSSVLNKLKEKQTISEEDVKKELEKNKQINLEFHNNVKQYFEEAKQIELNLEISISSDSDRNVQKEFDGEKQYIPEMDIEIQLDIEIPQQLDEKVLEEYGENKKCNEKLSKEFEKKKQEIKQNEYKGNIKVELNEDISNINKQLKYEFILERQLEEQKLKREKLIEQFHREIQEEVERLTCVVLYGEQNKSVQQCFTETEQVELITQIQQEIEELQREIEDSNQVNDEELEKEIIEKIRKTYSFSIQEKFLENLLLLYQDSKPLYEKITQLCSLYFPNMSKLCQSFNNEVPSEFEILMQQKIDEEVEHNNDEIHKFDTDTCIDVDDVTQQKLNEETYKEIEKIRVDSEVKNTINDSIIQSVGENIQYKCYGKKQEIEQKLQNQFEIKTPEKSLEEAQYGKVTPKVLSKVEKAMQINFYEEINEESKEKIQQHFEALKDSDENIQPLITGNIQNRFDKIVKQDANEYFDIVIQFNKEIKRKIDGIIQQVVKGKVHVCFNEEIMKISEKESLINVAKNILFNKNDDQSDTVGEIQNVIKNKDKQNVHNKLLHKIDTEMYKKFNGELKQSIKDKIVESYDEIKQKVDEIQEVNGKLSVEELQKNVDEEMEVDFVEQIQPGVKEQELQGLNKYLQGLNEELYVQLKFYKNINQEVEGESQEIYESQLKNDFEMNINKFIKVLLSRSADVQELNAKGDFDELEGKVQELLNQYDEKIEKNYNKNTQKLEKKAQEFEEETREEIQEVFEIGKFNEHTEEESDVDIENSEDETQDDFEVDVEKLDENIHREVIEPFNEINEVLEIVEEFEVKSASPMDNFILTEEHSCAEIEFSSSEEEFSSLEGRFNIKEENKELNEIVQHKLDNKKQVKYNTNIQWNVERLNDCTKDIKHNFEGELQEKVNRDLHQKLHQEFEESKLELKEENSQEFDGLKLEMGIENIKDSDEVPLELKIKQEKFEEELHLQFKKFQKEFYANLKIEYDKEQQLKVNDTFNPVLSRVFDEQQQTFYELKDEFNEIKQEYKTYVQQQIFEGLQREMDETQLLEFEEFPEKFENEPNLPINDDIHKEFVELQRDCYELESEFMYNVPFEFKEDNLSQIFNEKPLNLFEKLNAIHKKELCKFVDSDQWPEKFLYPSSLLDCLFENPLEDKPNALVITLYSVDVGYSIKLNITKEEPSVEIFFNYADDTILEYIEKEQLPPHLLDLLDRAEPRIFYCGCIIAEIHDQINGVPSKLYRILLRPFNMSIQSDLNQIIAENSHINWSYNKRLKLESMLILVSHPGMCMDSSSIAGLTVNLQHQLLSCRKIVLNPFKNNFNSLKLNLPENESLSTSLQMVDNTRNNFIYDLIWKFDFRIQSSKLIKLYVLVVREIQEYSMLMLMNSKDKSIITLRFKINLKTYKLKTYINVILKILRTKISSEILVVRRYKNSDKSTHSITNVPILFNDNIYEPSYAKISMLINKWLENKSDGQCYKTDFEYVKIKSSVLPVQLFEDTQKINEKKTSSSLNKKVDDKIDRDINVCSTKQLSNSSNKNIENEMSNLNLREKNQQILVLNKLKKESIFPRDKSPSNPVVVNSLPLKSPTSPMNIIMDFRSKSSSTESSTSCDPSIYSPILFVSLDNSDINGVTEELDEIQLTKNILPSVSSPIFVTLSLTTVPPAPNLVTTVSSVSNPTDIVVSISNPNTLISSISSHIAAVSSTKSNILSSGASNTNSSLVSEYLDMQTDKNQIPRLKVHNKNIDTILKPVVMSLKVDNLEKKKKNSSPLNLLNEFGKQLPTLHDGIKTETVPIFIQSLNSQCTKNIAVVKHLHQDGICLSGPKTLININEMSPITSLVPKTCYIEQTTTNLQLDRRKKIKFDDMLLGSNLTSPRNLQVKLPNVPLYQSNIYKKKNEDLFEDTAS